METAPSADGAGGCCNPAGGEERRTHLRGPAVSIYCQVILKPSATPGQLTRLGAALWRWCTQAAGRTGMYQYLDNQALADLLAGRLPAADPVASRGEQWGVRFRVGDGAFRDRQALIDSLRRQIPAEGVEDVRADGISWNAGAFQHPAQATV
jgi:hypothetical protein